MEIKGLYEMYSASSARSAGVRTAAQRGAEAAGPAGVKQAEKPADVDSVNISADGSLRSRVEKAEKPYEAAYTQGVSAQRIASLKEAYKGDCCPVPAQEIAGSILTQVLQVSA